VTSKNFPAGRPLPAGGSQGDVLTKQSDDDQDADWGAPALGTPADNVPAVATDVALVDLAASYNALLLALKAAGLMVAD
jgi:hypothetical protein